MSLVYDSTKNRITGSRNLKHDSIIRAFKMEYNDKFGIVPEISHGAIAKLINLRLKNHSIKGIVKIIEMFFKEEKGEQLVFDLKVILSSYFINKYAPKLRLDSKMYANAEEWNKEVY